MVSAGDTRIQDTRTQAGATHAQEPTLGGIHFPCPSPKDCRVWQGHWNGCIAVSLVARGLGVAGLHGRTASLLNIEVKTPKRGETKLAASSRITIFGEPQTLEKQVPPCPSEKADLGTSGRHPQRQPKPRLLPSWALELAQVSFPLLLSHPPEPFRFSFGGLPLS